jgi:tRNA threonylcarbamoyladenosine biosynthesis protein TsaE
VQQFKTESAGETQALGNQLSAILPDSGLVLLIGNLGAGKTTLVKGIVEHRGVGSPDDVSSPTYTLIHPYGDPVRIYHVDLYRLDTVDEVRGIGLDDLLDSDALVVIEWGEKFPELFARDRDEIEISITGECSRTVTYRRRSALAKPVAAT